MTEEEHQKYRDERDAKMILLMNKRKEEQASVGHTTKADFFALRDELENLKISYQWV